MAEPILNSVLEQRHNTYGVFKNHAKITQELKAIIRKYNLHRDLQGKETISDSQMESLEMIAHKIGRILNGDPNYDDSWVDIAGYAQLIVEELNGNSR